MASLSHDRGVLASRVVCVSVRRASSIAVALLVTLCPAARAQSVEGRVVDEETSVAVAGAVVVLLAEGGAQLQAVLSSDLGVFRFTVKQPESYSLRAEMIGRQSVEVGPFLATANGDAHTLRLPTLPIRLAGLEVTGEERCQADVQSARSVYTVWVEVEKALRATEVIRASVSHRFRIAEYERRRRKGSMNIVEEVTSQSDVVGGREPFRSLLPAEVERDGYIREEGGDLWIYGPSTELLLSRVFKDTHCFRLRRDRSSPGLIGLQFEPVDGREVADIRGVLWIDEGSAELRTLEFEYENTPRRLMRGDYTGAAEFLRLDDGGWIVERWWLRSPDPEHLMRIREQAGEVLGVERQVPPGPA